MSRPVDRADAAVLPASGAGLVTTGTSVDFLVSRTAGA